MLCSGSDKYKWERRDMVSRWYSRMRHFYLKPWITSMCTLIFILMYKLDCVIFADRRSCMLYRIAFITPIQKRLNTTSYVSKWRAVYICQSAFIQNQAIFGTCQCRQPSLIKTTFVKQYPAAPAVGLVMWHGDNIWEMCMSQGKKI